MEEDIEFITFDGDTITKSDFRDEIINKYIQANLDGLTKITDFNIGSEAYHLADVMASFILEHRELVDNNYRMSMIHTAEGEFLDNFGDMCGVHRYGSSGAVGEVTFTRIGTDTTDAIVIADGTQVSTDDAISFIVDNGGEDLVLESGATSISANVLCEQEGSYTNVLANTITLVMGDLGNLVTCTNPNAMSGGHDIEEDDDYRLRILLAPYNVPVGTLAWYENVALTLDSVHDVKVEKGVTVGDADVNITYNPVDWTDTSVALSDLQLLFGMKEYDVVGVTLDYELAEKVTMLPSSDGYLFALLLDSDYTIAMVKDDVVAKINKFNSDAMISVEFSPSTLASIIENEVAGVDNCRIVQYDSVNQTYTEIVEPILVDDNELAQVDLTNIQHRHTSGRVIRMSYDGTSFYGDLVVDEYDDKCNFIGTNTSTGFYVYHILGDSFDMMSEQCSKFLNDCSILSADASSLDKFWGVSYDMPRPKLNEGTAQERYLSDDEYRTYLYLRNCQLLTREDIEVNMNKALGTDDFTIYFSEETNYLSATDHLTYTPTVTDTSNLAKNDDDTTNDYIVNIGSEDDVHLIEGNLCVIDSVVQVINIPYGEWDSDFLSFLEQYISVKGNLQIREYNL